MILLLDDHPLARQGLESIIKLYKPAEEIIQVGCIKEALEILLSQNITLAFVDIYLNQENGLDFVEMARKTKPDLKFIIISSSSRQSDFLRAKMLGVNAFILKEAFIDEIVFGLSRVDENQKYYSPGLLESIGLDGDEKLLETLTDREMQIMLFLSDGRTNGDISDQLMISEGTVKKHVSNIMGKLDCQTRVNAVLFANRNKAKIHAKMHTKMHRSAAWARQGHHA